MNRKWIRNKRKGKRKFLCTPPPVKKKTSPKKVGPLYLLPPIHHFGEWATLFTIYPFYESPITIITVWSAFVAKQWVSACFCMFFTFRIICNVGTICFLHKWWGREVLFSGGGKTWDPWRQLSVNETEVPCACVVLILRLKCIYKLQFLHDLHFDAVDSVPVV